MDGAAKSSFEMNSSRSAEFMLFSTLHRVCTRFIRSSVFVTIHKTDEFLSFVSYGISVCHRDVDQCHGPPNGPCIHPSSRCQFVLRHLAHSPPKLSRLDSSLKPKKLLVQAHQSN